jgi:hypothetical protein
MRLLPLLYRTGNAKLRYGFEKLFKQCHLKSLFILYFTLLYRTGNAELTYVFAKIFKQCHLRSLFILYFTL